MALRSRSSGPRPAFAVARFLCLALAILWPDHAVAQTGTITGTVARVSGSSPIPLAGVTVVLTTGYRSEVGPPQTTDASGVYTFTGLEPGLYHLHTRNDLGFTNEVYNDVLCWQAQCQPESGAPLVVTPGAVVIANFTLEPAGIVSGTVTDAATSVALPGVRVRLVPLDMDPVFYYEASSRVETDAGGVYTVRGLPAGRYYAFTENDLGYVDELYDNIPCPAGACVYFGSIGVPIQVAPGLTTGSRDFALDRGGRISGTITDAVTTEALDGACVYIVQLVGILQVGLGSDCVDGTGVYEVVGLPSGTFVAWAFPPDASDYVSELYDDVPCAGYQCLSLLANATPIAVTLGATTAGRDFALGTGGAIRGRVVDAVSSAPLQWVPVGLVARGSSGVVFVHDDTTDATGQFEIHGLPPGTYYALTASSRYPNEIYDDIPCPGDLCSESLLAAVGTPITVSAGGVSTGIDFGLRTDLPPGPPQSLSATVDNYAVTLSWYPSSQGAPPTSYVIEAGLTPGTTIVTLPTTGETYMAAPVGPGRYFVRVRAVNAHGIGPASEEIVVVVAPGGTGATAPEAPKDVVGWMSGARLTLTWNPPWSPSGADTSYVVEAGSTTGVTNVASIAVGQAALTYVPAPNGFYFVRVRAVNAAGISPPSSEVLVNAGNVPAPPGAPWNLAFRVTGSTVTLRWQAPYAWLGTPTSYLVRAGSAPGLSNLAQTNAGGGTTAVFSGVPAGTYYVRVHAVNSLGAGVASNELKVVVP